MHSGLCPLSLEGFSFTALQCGKQHHSSQEAASAVAVGQQESAVPRSGPKAQPGKTNTGQQFSHLLTVAVRG